MSQTCPTCGSTLPGSDSFCFKCGKDINAPRIETEKEPEAYLYVEAANGMTVRIPASKLESWSKAQDEIRAGTRKPDEKIVRELAALIKGDPKPQEETPDRENSEETRVAVKDRNGKTVWLPASEVSAFQKGQEALQRGERPPDFEQKKAAVMAKLLGEDKAEKPLSAAQRSAKSFAETYTYRCPNCNVPRQSKDGTCNACGLTYAQAETIVRQKKENEVLQAKQQEAKTSAKKKNGEKSLVSIFVSLLRNIAGLIVAFAVFFAVYLFIYWLVTLIARTPILGSIIYWPSDAALFRTFTTRVSSVFAASWVSLKIAKTAKPFCTVLILLNVWAIVSSLIHKNFSFSVLEDCGIFIAVALFFFKAKPDDI